MIHPPKFTRRRSPLRTGPRGVGRRGFTLIELTVAAALVGIVIAAGAAFTSQVSGARERLRKQADTRVESEAAIRALSTAIQSLARNPSEADRRDVPFLGTDEQLQGRPADRLRFLMSSHRVIRPGEPEADVREVEFFLRETGTDPLPALMRRTDPTRNAVPDGGGVVELIARRVVGFDIEYFTGEAWVIDWPELYDRPPTALRLRVAIAPPIDESRPDGLDAAVAEAVSVRRLIHFPYLPTQGDDQADGFSLPSEIGGAP